MLPCSGGELALTPNKFACSNKPPFLGSVWLVEKMLLLLDGPKMD